MNETKRCPFCGEEILAVAIKCKHCQSNLQANVQPTRPRSAEAEVRTAQKPKTAAAVKALLVIIIATAVILWLNNPSEPVGTEPARVAPTAPAVSTEDLVEARRPQQETRFVDAVVGAQSKSRSANNDMQKGGVLAERDKAICSIMRTRKVSGWTGTVKSVDANSDGKGVLIVEIADNVVVRTWNNSLSDMYDQTLIEQDTPLFHAASALTPGAAVIFSGTFAGGLEDKCVEESSLTLGGKLSEPEFIFNFNAIAPLTAATAGAVVMAAPAPSAVTDGSANEGPSFNCSIARSPAERLICDDPELSVLDRELASVFKEAKRDAQDQEAFSRENRQAWKEREDTCRDKDCLLEWFAKRRAQLEQDISEANPAQ